MPIDLHQRLSEFSYGYGITREIQAHLELIGLKPVPFLPSLVHEAKIGCDVHFSKPGIALLIQFKLGEELKQFRRGDKSKPAPKLEKPYWRFQVNTAEEDGQYDLLLKAERAGAEVYYVAPRFSDWDHYAVAFHNNTVLNDSLLIKPSEIDGKLQVQGEPDGWHKIVYDGYCVYVCSAPKQVAESRFEDIGRNLLLGLEGCDETIGTALKRVFDSFSQRRNIRRAMSETPLPDNDLLLEAMQPEEFGRTSEQMVLERTRRLEALRALAITEDDAMFAAVGLEAWAAGSQLLAVTPS